MLKSRYMTQFPPGFSESDRPYAWVARPDRTTATIYRAKHEDDVPLGCVLVGETTQSAMMLDFEEDDWTKYPLIFLSGEDFDHISQGEHPLLFALFADED